MANVISKPATFRDRITSLLGNRLGAGTPKIAPSYKPFTPSTTNSLNSNIAPKVALPYSPKNYGQLGTLSPTISNVNITPTSKYKPKSFTNTGGNLTQNISSPKVALPRIAKIFR